MGIRIITLWGGKKTTSIPGFCTVPTDY